MPDVHRTSHLIPTLGNRRREEGPPRAEAAVRVGKEGVEISQVTIKGGSKALGIHTKFSIQNVEDGA